MVSPLARERMIDVARWQRSIDRKKVDRFRQERVERLAQNTDAEGVETRIRGAARSSGTWRRSPRASRTISLGRIFCGPSDGPKTRSAPSMLSRSARSWTIRFSGWRCALAVGEHLYPIKRLSDVFTNQREEGHPSPK
jgi:hypothetical protein